MPVCSQPGRPSPPVDAAFTAWFLAGVALRCSHISKGYFLFLVVDSGLCRSLGADTLDRGPLELRGASLEWGAFHDSTMIFWMDSSPHRGHIILTVSVWMSVERGMRCLLVVTTPSRDFPGE
jgi:hypothetical protein